MYIIPYEADFGCPKGHVFKAAVPGPAEFGQAEGNEVRCPHCYEAWIAENVPNGKQASERRPAPIYNSATMD